jgi:UDP-MurNAc hydroxylase
VSIKVRYIYSACIVLETEDVKVLCDPWISEGAYDGSWYHYPKLKNPIDAIGFVELIYISHIHPDHYDPKFLKIYLAKYPKTKIIIAPFQKNFLSKRMQFDGIPHTIETNVSLRNTKLWLIPNERDWFDVDSALLVEHKGHTVVNMNDNIYNQNHIDKIKKLAPSIQIALLTYAGAGPYPQAYYDIGSVLIEKATEKKQNFFKRYQQMRDALSPEISIPFAGKYLLGGHLYYLNSYRGVSDPVEVLAFDKAAVILEDGGQSWIDTKNLQPNASRTDPYDVKHMEAYALKLSQRPMDYEHTSDGLDTSTDFSEGLCQKAYENAIRKSPYKKDYWFCIWLQDGWFVMNCNSSIPSCEMTQDVSNISPRTEVYLDLRYLHGLLKRKYHWSIAEIGSQLKMRRFPDIYDEQAQNFLNYFHS